MKTYGRTTIYSKYTEEELLKGSDEEQANKVLTILKNAIPIHDTNKYETEYLVKYYSGIQDIYTEKEKHTREEINNKTVENWAFAFIDFKKAFLLGKEIQYVSLDGQDNEEIDTLNNYVRFEGKKSKDIDLYEDVLVTGRGFRYIAKDKITDDNEVPFEIINCDPALTEVVYSSKMGNEQLFAFVETGMIDTITVVDEETGEEKDEQIEYSEYTVYTRNFRFVFNDKSGDLEYQPEETKVKLIKEHSIIEYYVHRLRLSLIEIGKDIFNDINYLESLDKDDMEQFVNAIMIFTNAKIDKNGLDMIKELGAACINSTDTKKASVDLLQQRLNATDTQVYYNRLLSALHQILGVPQANHGGGMEIGDTGRAQLTGQGYLSAGIRIQNDETKFGDADLKTLNIIIKLCKETIDSGIKDLKLTALQPKFQIDMSENLLVKTQALQNLYECKIPRTFANSIINLFPDPNAVTIEQNKLYGEEGQENIENTNANVNNNFGNTNNKINEQNNEMRKTQELENQGQ